MTFGGKIVFDLRQSETQSLLMQIKDLSGALWDKVPMRTPILAQACRAGMKEGTPT